MSTINSTIKFNTTTGSDTQSSGCGPVTAVYGSSAETDGTGTVDVSMDGVSLSSISVGDLLFCDVSSGRKFAVITSVDTINETITCGDSFVTESGVSWAVGGKRATFENAASRNLFNESSYVTATDVTFLVAETETDQTVSSTLSRSASGVANKTNFVFLSQNKSAIISNGNFSAITMSQQVNTRFVGLKFLCTFSGTRDQPAVKGGRMTFYDCEIGEDGGSNNFLEGVQSNTYSGYASLVRCKVYGTGLSGNGIRSTYYASGNVSIEDCIVKDFYYGVRVAETVITVRNSVLSNMHSGVYGRRRSLHVHKSIFNEMQGDAVYYDNTSNYLTDEDFGSRFFHYNIAVNVAGYIIKNDVHSTHEVHATALGSLESSKAKWFTFNCPNKVQGNAPISEVELTANPFVDAANGDFNINATGGAALRSTSYTLGG
jgi:hypothetical protein